MIGRTLGFETPRKWVEVAAIVYAVVQRASIPSSTIEQVLFGGIASSRHSLQLPLLWWRTKSQRKIVARALFAGKNQNRVTIKCCSSIFVVHARQNTNKMQCQRIGEGAPIGERRMRCYFVGRHTSWLANGSLPGLGSRLRTPSPQVALIPARHSQQIGHR